MQRLVWLVLAPFVGAGIVTTLVGPRLHAAHACSCVPDQFWVVEDVTVEGAPAAFPANGHLYPDRLHLWAEGFQVDLEYSP